MSDGSATYEDLLQLIEEAQHRVQETFSVSLVPEVRIISFPH
ncbi:MAG: hypothetical protein H6767_06415 [Candidatus Peribacteria bacterium]|nr:MAG: hypothetical protein H6767_06415 [Candidatus Peribacteria bacterium]